jgi:hypothetical protein
MGKTTRSLASCSCLCVGPASPFEHLGSDQCLAGALKPRDGVFLTQAFERAAHRDGSYARFSSRATSRQPRLEHDVLDATHQSEL